MDKGNSDKDKLSVGERKDDSFYVTERKESVMMGENYRFTGICSDAALRKAL